MNDRVFHNRPRRDRHGARAIARRPGDRAGRRGQLHQRVDRPVGATLLEEPDRGVDHQHGGDHGRVGVLVDQDRDDEGDDEFESGDEWDAGDVDEYEDEGDDTVQAWDTYYYDTQGE
jgi:hypothetical protein